MSEKTSTPVTGGPKNAIGAQFFIAEPPEKNFETRVTEAEERALEAVRGLQESFEDMSFALQQKDDYEGAARFEWAARDLSQAVKLTIAAAALARDYARREG